MSIEETIEWHAAQARIPRPKPEPDPRIDRTSPEFDVNVWLFGVTA